MANEFKAGYPTGNTLYVIVMNEAGQVYDVTNSTFNAADATSLDTNRGDYDNPVAEISTSGIYLANEPSGLDPNTVYYAWWYLQAGASPSMANDTYLGTTVFHEYTAVTPWVIGTVTGSPAAGTFAGDSALSSTDDFYNGSALAFTSGTLDGIVRRISDYTGSTNTFTFDDAFPTAPSATDTFIIVGLVA